jgi:hypothetical protein
MERIRGIQPCQEVGEAAGGPRYNLFRRQQEVQDTTLSGSRRSRIQLRKMAVEGSGNNHVRRQQKVQDITLLEGSRGSRIQPCQ